MKEYAHERKNNSNTPVWARQYGQKRGEKQRKRQLQSELEDADPKPMEPLLGQDHRMPKRPRIYGSRPQHLPGNFSAVIPEKISICPPGPFRFLPTLIKIFPPLLSCDDPDNKLISPEIPVVEAPV